MSQDENEYAKSNKPYRYTAALLYRMGRKKVIQRHVQFAQETIEELTKGGYETVCY